MATLSTGSLVGTVPQELLPVNIPAPPPAPIAITDPPISHPGSLDFSSLDQFRDGSGGGSLGFVGGTLGTITVADLLPPQFVPAPRIPLPVGGTILDPNPSIPANTTPRIGVSSLEALGGTTVAIPVPLPGPSAPGGSIGLGLPGQTLGFSPTAAQGTAGCNLLPAGAIRDACLAAAGFFLRPGTAPALPQLPGAAAPVTGGGGGLATPTLRSVTRMECPRFANGSKGILWMNINGQVVCLPRGVNGSGFGLFRKNKKRAKPFISAAQIKELKSVKRTQKKAKKFASLAGLTAHSKGAHRGR